MKNLSFTRQVYRGKTLGRILFNRAVARHAGAIAGDVLDLASGAAPSYAPLLPKHIRLVSTDLSGGRGVVVADLDQRLPFADGSFDTVLFFNAVYAVRDAAHSLREIRRVLRPGGSLLLSSPFLSNEMPEPHDYLRFTSEGLERLFRDAGFSSFTIEPYGERFSAAANLLHPFFLFNTVRLAGYPFVLLFDTLIPATLRERHPAPLGYFCIATP